MWRWLAGMLLGNPWSLYRDALSAYPDRFHARVAFLFSLTATTIPFMIYYSAVSAQECMVRTCPADYTLVGLWLIVVPIGGMAILNWRLVMKPTLERKRRMRSGTNGGSSR